jgi:CRISPR-associated protein Csm1
MSLQVFLQAQLLGGETFLSSLHAEQDDASDLVGRCSWLTLLGEVVPRALLAELKLSRMLLGSSSAEQFLLVLAEEDIPRANQFLNHAAAAISRVSGNTLRLVWATTENLGAWPVVRKRLEDALTAKGLVSAVAVGWSAESPLVLVWDSGTHSWPLKEQSSFEEDGILFPRRFAMDDESGMPAKAAELAERAEGADRWGILQGDVDHFGVQLRRAGTVEEHIHFSALFQEFFAGELALLCAMPDFWRKVTVLYRGGDDFAVLGSWDALILLAREIARVFERFVDQHLATLPGVEAKTISVAIALAPQIESSATSVFAQAATELRITKSAELGSIHLFGRSLEWKRLGDAEELKASLVRLVRECRAPASYLDDLASVYRESFSARATRRGKSARAERPWRTYMRLSRVIPQTRGREQTNLRNAVITNLVGKGAAGLKLRPPARVGLEWARLEAQA